MHIQSWVNYLTKYFVRMRMKTADQVRPISQHLNETRWISNCYVTTIISYWTKWWRALSSWALLAFVAVIVAVWRGWLVFLLKNISKSLHLAGMGVMCFIILSHSISTPEKHFWCSESRPDLIFPSYRLQISRPYDRSDKNSRRVIDAGVHFKYR